MKIKITGKVMAVVVIAVFCLVGIVFFYRHISEVDAQADFNWYSLVPPESDVLLYAPEEADFIERLCSEEYRPADSLSGCGERALLPVVGRGLFQAGFSTTELLLAHVPDGSQILFCKLSVEDSRVVESVLSDVGGYSPKLKSVPYCGNQISVCPLPGDAFICSSQVAPMLWVVSFQKKTVEQVLQRAENGQAGAVRLPVLAGGEEGPQIWMRGKELAEIHRLLPAGYDESSWMMFRLNFDNQKVVLSGLEERLDAAEIGRSCLPVSPLHILPDSLLPYTTGQYRHEAFTPSSDMEENSQLTPMEQSFIRLLSDNGAHEQFACRFVPVDTCSLPVVAGLLVEDSEQCEHDFRRWMRYYIGYGDAKAFCYKRGEVVPLYKLPPMNICASLLEGVSDQPCWTAIVDGWMLFAPSRLLLLDFLNQGRYSPEKLESGFLPPADGNEYFYVSVSKCVLDSETGNRAFLYSLPCFWQLVNRPLCFQLSGKFSGNNGGYLQWKWLAE